MQGEHSDVMFIVESGVVTCHMDFLRLHHCMQLPTLSQDVLAVAPVRSDTPFVTCKACFIVSLAWLSLLVCVCLLPEGEMWSYVCKWLVTSQTSVWMCMPHLESVFAYTSYCSVCDTDQRCWLGCGLSTCINGPVQA